MLITTIDTIPGKNCEAIGIVRGGTTHVVNSIGDMGGSLRSMNCRQARDLATERMLIDADALDADAVVGVRYLITVLTPGVVEVLAYGTAVKYKAI